MKKIKNKKIASPQIRQINEVIDELTPEQQDLLEWTSKWSKNLYKVMLKNNSLANFLESKQEIVDKWAESYENNLIQEGIAEQVAKGLEKATILIHLQETVAQFKIQAMRELRPPTDEDFQKANEQ